MTTKADIAQELSQALATNKRGRKPGPPAVSIRMSADMMASLLKIKHHMENLTQESLSMRDAVDNAICLAVECLENEKA